MDGLDSNEWLIIITAAATCAQAKLYGMICPQRKATSESFPDITATWLVISNCTLPLMNSVFQLHFTKYGLHGFHQWRHSHSHLRELQKKQLPLLLHKRLPKIFPSLFTGVIHGLASAIANQILTPLCRVDPKAIM